MTCTARVWANGDDEECRKPISQADRCAWHVEHEIIFLRESIAKCEQDIASHHHRLEELGVPSASDRPRLTHVACRDEKGRIWSLPWPFRHHHVIRLIDDHGGKAGSGSDQGFLDQSGRYLTRDQALVSAEANDQIKNGKIIGGVLTSEDLWP